MRTLFFFFFFFNDTATTEIYTLSLHDALPIYQGINLMLALLIIGAALALRLRNLAAMAVAAIAVLIHGARDRKSTRLNSSHLVISYAVFCLKKKKQHNISTRRTDIV